jgi:serine/threonine-protein kinase RsbW
MSDVVELSIPVQADLVVLARLTAATVAARAGFDVEEVEDLRLAVDELCLSVIEGAPDGRLLLTFTRVEDRVDVQCVLDGGALPEGAPSAAAEGDGLSALIIEALVDEHGAAIEDGQRRAWLRKRRAPLAEG